jgi:hypothetical protein
MKSTKLIAVVLTALISQGCSTLFTDKTNSINLATSNGKPITVTIDDEEFQGPGVITLVKNGKDKIITTSTNGCVPQTLLKKELEPAFFINVVAGPYGSTGSTTDAATKKMWKYKDSVTVNCQ